MVKIVKKLNPIAKGIIEKTWFKTPYLKNKREKYIEFMTNRYKLENNPSIISSNCIGGIIYNNLNQKFLSPTINLFIPGKDFIKLIENLDIYIKLELTFKETSKGGYPIGMLKDITIHFNHYKTFNEAKEKWDERVKRINLDNIYIVMHDRNLSYEEIKNLSSVNCKRLIVFSHKSYHEFDYVYQLKRYSNKQEVGSFVIKDIDGFREFEKAFDYVDWLNGGQNFENKYSF